MIILPEINPVAISIGPLSIYWYGVAYAMGIFLALTYAKIISNKYDLTITPKLLDDYLIYLIVGIILGGRVGYIMIYEPAQYAKIFQIRDGGMSFHGGLMGVALASYIFCKVKKLHFLALTDIVSTVAPIAIFLGRIANFINAELYGRVTKMPWGFVFPTDLLHSPRHPSQLYEAFFEGVVLSCIMYFFASKIRQIGYLTGVFLILYHSFRIFCEFFREPDNHIGFFFGYISMGQLLSIPFLILGFYLCQLNKK